MKVEVETSTVDTGIAQPAARFAESLHLAILLRESLDNLDSGEHPHQRRRLLADRLPDSAGSMGGDAG